MNLVGRSFKVPAAIVTADLSKTYKSSHRPALESVSFELGSGRITTILGRNGAGKTTLLRILCTQLVPSSGKAYVLGHDVLMETSAVRKLVSAMPQDGRPFGTLTPRDHISLTLAARGSSLNDASRAASKIMEEMELEIYKNTPCNRLSGGLKQRVLLCMCLAADSSLYILDEPTVGLDPIAREQTWSLIRKLVRNGKSIVFSTHYMDEAQRVSDEAAMLVEGKIVSCGSVQSLMKSVGGKYRVEIVGMKSEEVSSYGSVMRLPDSIRVYANEVSARELVALATSKQFPASIAPASLEDAFLVLSKVKID